jgi:hypothetical protein
MTLPPEERGVHRLLIYTEVITCLGLGRGGYFVYREAPHAACYEVQRILGRKNNFWVSDEGMLQIQQPMCIR